MMMRRKSLLAAAGLDYDKNTKEAPRVLVFEKGESAMHVVRLARRYGIPVKMDDSLVDKLSSVPVDQKVTQLCYRDVAKLLIEVGRF